MTPTTSHRPPRAPLTVEQIAAMREQYGTENGLVHYEPQIIRLLDEHAALRDRLARAGVTRSDLRAHIAELERLFERRGQRIEEQRIALARAEERCGVLEARIARYAEKCAEIEHEYHAIAWHPDQCASVTFENRIIEVGQMAIDDGAARPGGCPLGGTAEGEGDG